MSHERKSKIGAKYAREIARLCGDVPIRNPEYYSISSSGWNQMPCSIADEAVGTARKTWMCLTGYHPTAGATVIDMWLDCRTPPNTPLNFVMYGMVLIAHVRFFELLGEENVKRDLFIGRVYNKGGKQLDDWVTIRGRKRIAIRGRQQVRYRRCLVCGRGYYGSADGNYLYPAPPADRAIYESNNLGFIVNREIGRRIRERRWRTLRVEPLAVLDPPPDGLGVLPA